MKSTGDAVQDAERDLAWLREVNGLRKFEAVADGQFLVTLRDYQKLEMDAAAVAAFRAGVLVGWRLPRAEGVIG